MAKNKRSKRRSGSVSKTSVSSKPDKVYGARSITVKADDIRRIQLKTEPGNNTHHKFPYTAKGDVEVTVDKQYDLFTKSKDPSEIRCPEGTVIKADHINFGGRSPNPPKGPRHEGKRSTFSFFGGAFFQIMKKKKG